MELQNVTFSDSERLQYPIDSDIFNSLVADLAIQGKCKHFC